jgi:predicted DNA binding CopG/RHH family protein
MTETKVFKSDLKVPKFATEEEEAKWWFDNQDIVFEEFKKAAKAGTLGRGGARRLFAEKGIPFPEPKPSAPTPTTTIRLDPDDIAKAREQAAKRGLRYQTYLKMIIHEALLKEERKDTSMRFITITRNQQGFRIDPPMGTADGAAGSGLPERYASQDRLQARLRSYGFTNDEIAKALGALEEKGELDLPLPLGNVA